MTDQSDAEVSSPSVCSQASSLSWAGDYVTRSSDHWSFPAAALAAPSHVNFEVCGQGNLSAPFPPYPVLQVNTCYSSLAPDSSWDNDRAMGEFAWQQGCEEAEEEEEYCEDYGPYEEQEADEESLYGSCLSAATEECSSSRWSGVDTESRASPECMELEPDLSECQVVFQRIPVMCVINLAYLGDEFRGIQKNSSGPTVQGCLQEHMMALGAIPEGHENFCLLSSRTDKGVHAAQMVVVVMMKRIACLLQLSAFVARLNRCLKASKHSLEVIAMRQFEMESRLSRQLASKKFYSPYFIQSRRYKYIIPSFVLALVQPDIVADPQKLHAHMKTARLSEQQLAHAQEVLSCFQRHDDFKAFTEDAKAEHYYQTIREVFCLQVKELVCHDKIEYAVIQIEGKGFMYLQIRKMIGLAILIIQAGLAPRENIDRVFKGMPLPGKDKVSSFRVAPAEPLFLEYIDFRYDKIKDFLEEPGSLQKNEAFKRTCIIPHVYRQSVKPILNFITELSGCTSGDVHVLRKFMQEEKRRLSQAGVARASRDREPREQQDLIEQEEQAQAQEEKKLSRKMKRRLRHQTAFATPS